MVAKCYFLSPIDGRPWPSTMLDNGMHISDHLATLWLRYFKVSPKTTLAISLAAISVITTTISIFSEFDKERRNLLLKEKNKSFQTQIVQLNETEKNIKNLLAFVQTQKDSLHETEQALQKLKSERDKIQPLLQVDRATLETFFKVQEERATANVWRERVIGFISGLVASLLASVLWAIAASLGKKNSLQKQKTDIKKEV